jgi:hypothetical protein
MFIPGRTNVFIATHPDKGAVVDSCNGPLHYSERTKGRPLDTNYMVPRPPEILRDMQRHMYLEELSVTTEFQAATGQRFTCEVCTQSPNLGTGV